jgi:flagellar FliL protein
MANRKAQTESPAGTALADEDQTAVRASRVGRPKESGMSGSKPEAAAAKGGGKKGRLLVVVGAVLLVAGGAGGFFWWKSHGAAEAASATPDAHGEAEAAAAPAAGALPFQPFIVNLADAGASRYLKADIRLLVSGEPNIKELEENEVVMLRLRSAILEHLSQQTSDRIATPDGKDALKKAIAEKCTKILGHATVTDVLFAEFVVQY